jgi:hypothetical protein
MHRKLGCAVLAAITVGLVSAAVGLAGTVTTAATGANSMALFEGHEIDLSQGWGEAQACLVDEAVDVIECFRDRLGLYARESQLGTANTVSPAITCSSPLRLFADASYGGRELDFYDRGYWQNLSTWSFDNQLSSYKVGACGVFLADGANGGGSWYPGNTNAGHDEPSMLSGWNDRVSSLYIQ